MKCLLESLQCKNGGSALIRPSSRDLQEKSLAVRRDLKAFLVLIKQPRIYPLHILLMGYSACRK
jgi:hypothetical protein